MADQLARQRRLRQGFEDFGKEHPALKATEHQERLTAHLEAEELAATDAPSRRKRGRPSKGIGAQYRQLSLFFPPELLEKLDRLVDREQQRTRRSVTRTDLIREAVEGYVTTRLDVPTRSRSAPSPPASAAPMPAAPSPHPAAPVPAVAARGSAPRSDVPDAPPFDPSKFALSKDLCPRGHEFGRTGRTLLRLPQQTCPQCENEKKRERRRQARAGG